MCEEQQEIQKSLLWLFVDTSIEVTLQQSQMVV